MTVINRLPHRPQSHGPIPSKTQAEKKIQHAETYTYTYMQVYRTPQDQYINQQLNHREYLVQSAH
jgi:hypothetical protein